MPAVASILCNDHEWSSQGAWWEGFNQWFAATGALICKQYCGNGDRSENSPVHDW